ncbi:hypothetical protein MKX03_012631 [Papaver bracteatum]|nr:hypothetical protein MKX03_012631 [Papaver bracteatum]
MDEFSDIETIFFSYLIVHTSAIQIFSSDFSYLLLRRKIQVVLALLMLVTVKGFLSNVLFFSKYSYWHLLYYIGNKLHSFVVIVVIFISMVTSANLTWSSSGCTLSGIPLVSL